MQAACAGAVKARTWLSEIAVSIAWHVAVFGNLAQKGQLKPWTHYRDQLRGISVPAKAQDWKVRQTLRAEQMKRFKKHQAIRTKVPKKHGR